MWKRGFSYLPNPSFLLFRRFFKSFSIPFTIFAIACRTNRNRWEGVHLITMSNPRGINRSRIRSRKRIKFIFILFHIILKIPSTNFFRLNFSRNLTPSSLTLFFFHLSYTFSMPSIHLSSDQEKMLP